MTNRVLATAAAGALLLIQAAPASAQNALGLWLTKNRDAKVRVSNCGGSLCGAIAWLAEPIDPKTGKPAVDDNNPDPSKRNRSMIGVRIFGMKPDGSNRWSGWIYNADDGKTYNGTVELLGPNALKVEGCLGPFCDHEIWGRTK